MRKYAVPGTYVPGASLVRNPETLAIVYNNKGNPIWQMPKPFGIHTTMQVVKQTVEGEDGKPKTIKVRQPMQFPVYRGLDASLARWIRAQMRRANRKAEEAKEAKRLKPLAIIKDVLGGVDGGAEAGA